MATEQDIETVARISAAGFYSDPVMSWVLRDDGARLHQLDLVFHQVVTHFFPDRGIIGVLDDASVCLWRDPSFDHRAVPAEVEVEAESEDDEGDGGDAADPPFSAEELERFDLLTTAMAEHHPHDPHWYLFVVSTLPERQGQGLGAAVLAPVLAQCDAEGVPAYLESTNPRNMTLYRRLGFEQTGEIPLPDGPSLYPMWREPHAP